MASRTGRIRPPNTGLTEEAKAALNLDEEPEEIPTLADIGIDSEAVEVEAAPPLFDESGDFIDDSRLKTKAPPPPPPREAKPGIPSLDEWLDFFSRIFLRVVCDWYISLAFRGVNEDLLTDREVDRLQLSEEERKRIAVPLAELSHKSKIMRKHGRTIVASGGAFDAVIALGMWASRVNRIARKYKPKTVQGKIYERTGPGTPSGEPDPNAGANGGRVGGEWTIYNPGG